MAASFFLSPRAAERIAAARDFLLRLPGGAPFLVVGHRRHAADRLCHAVAEHRGALFGAYRFGFSVLAESVAAPELARSGRRPLTPAARRALVAHVVYRARQDAGLGRFTPVAAGPGLVARLASTFEELRLAGLAPDAVAALDPDVGRLYTAYSDALEASRLADRASAFAAARRRAEAAAGGERASPPFGLPVVFVDVPLLDQAAQGFARALNDQAPEALWTLPAGDRRTEAALRGFGATAAPSPSSRERSPAAGEDAVRRAQRHLFTSRTDRTPPADDGLTVVSAPGGAAEALEGARILLQEARGGTRFDRMAVLLPQPDEQATRFAEAFGRAGIPAFLEAGARLPHPAGRAFLALLDCALDGVSASRFAEYLSLGQTRTPEDAGRGAGGDDGPPPAYVAPRRWEQLLLDSEVIGGLDRWERRLGLFDDELAGLLAQTKDPDKSERLARRRADLAQLAAAALPIVRRLDALTRGPRSWGRWAEDLRELAEQALLQPEGVLDCLRETAPMAEVDGVALAEVREGLAHRLSEVVRRSAGSRYGRVWVGSIEAARGLSFEVVVVPGFTERAFPQIVREDPMLLDGLRRRLGASLPLRSDRAEQERMRLRIAVGAATRRLVLSYSSLRLEEARPQVPSYYLAEAFSAAHGRVPTLDAIRGAAGAGSLVIRGARAPVDSSHAVDLREFGLSRIVAALGTSRGAPASGAAAFLLRDPVVARSLRHEYLRQQRKWTAADGFLFRTDDETRDALARYRPGVHPYSATGLQTFAECPYRFFLKNLARLRPIERPEAAIHLDPLTRGSFFHEVLYYLGLDLRPLAPLEDDDRIARAMEALARRFEEVEPRYRERTAPPVKRIWKDETAGLLGEFREFVRRFAADGAVPVASELSFGLGPRRGPADPASVESPVTLPGGLELHGSIDSVERLPDGRVRVTDYKTGKARVEVTPTSRVLFGGRALQPVLYALAYEELSGGPVAEGRLYYATVRGGYREAAVDTSGIQARDVFGRFVSLIDDAVRKGRFPAAPLSERYEHACTFCDYRPICGPRPSKHDLFKRGNREPLAEVDAVRLLS